MNKGTCIENINIIENIKKVYTKQWRTIHEVIKPYFKKETDISPDDFIKKRKDSANEARFLPLEVNNNIKWMAIEQALYAQVVVICRKGLKFTEPNKNKNEAKFKSQGQFSRS